MRKKFIDGGLDAFAEHEVLEMLLYYVYPRKDTNETAHNMIRQFGTLSRLLEADVSEIMKQCGCTENVAVLLHMVPALANYYLRSKQEEKVILRDEKAAGRYALTLFVGRSVEMFYLLCLDNRYRLNHASLISKGTMDESAVYPRALVKDALLYEATRVILAHNHPSGSVVPSRQDKEVTRQIVECMKILRIDVTDHIIVSGSQYYSFAAHGQIVMGY